MRDISSILYNLGSFYSFQGTFKNRENLGGVSVGGRGVNPSSIALQPTPQYRPFCPTPAFVLHLDSLVLLSFSDDRHNATSAIFPHANSPQPRGCRAVPPLLALLR